MFSSTVKSSYANCFETISLSNCFRVLIWKKNRYSFCKLVCLVVSGMVEMFELFHQSCQKGLFVILRMVYGLKIAFKSLYLEKYCWKSINVGYNHQLATFDPRL